MSLSARLSVIRSDLPERGSHVAPLHHFFHQVFTVHWAFGWLSRCERINPRSRFPRLHPSFPVKGQLDWLAVFHSALKRQRLLASPHRSGLQCHSAPTMPSADSCRAVKVHCWSFSPWWFVARWDALQVSRGKSMDYWCTTAGFTPVVLDGYGLRALTRTRPTSAPPIQFLSVGSHLCSTLPSDNTSRCCPCASLTFTSIRLVEGLAPSEPMNMPGTRKYSTA